MRNCQLKIAENKIYFTITNRSFYKNKVIESLIGTIVWAKKMNIWKEKEFKGKFLHRDDYWQKSSVRICNNFDFVNFNSAFISPELGLCFFLPQKKTRYSIFASFVIFSNKYESNSNFNCSATICKQSSFFW